MTEKQNNSKKQVMFLIRRGKRGYIVEAAGSGEPYPCLTAADIGEAVIEMLDDPNQKSVEAVAPEPDRAERSSAGAPPEPERGSEPEPPPRGNVRPNGWTAGDELLVGLAGNLLSKARKFSDWDRS